MANGTGIRVDLNGILDVLDAISEVDVEFVSSEASSTEFVQSMNHATAMANEDEAGAYGGSIVATVDGVAVSLRDVGSSQDLGNWLANFARRLEDEGRAGLIRAVPTVSLPAWFNSIPDQRPTIFTALDGVDLGENTKLAREGLQPATGDKIIGSAIAWAMPNADVVIVNNVGLCQRLPAGDAGVRCVSRMLGASHTVHVQCLNIDSHTGAQIGFNRNGQVVYGFHASAISMEDRLEKIRAAVLAAGTQTRLSFARLANAWAHNWASLASVQPAPVHIPGHALWVNSDVWQHLVPDAHGIQLLSQEHIERAEDLSRWRVTEIGKGSFLVETDRPEDWFGPGGPSTEVLAAARADFGSMIATQNDL